MKGQPPPELKIGIICQSLEWSLWEARVVEKALENPTVKLALFILPAERRPVQGKRHPGMKSRRRSNILLRLYSKIFISRYYGKRDVSSHYKDIPRMQFPDSSDPDNSGGSIETLSRTIKKEDLHAIIFLSGFSKIPKEIINAAKFGTWAFRHRLPSEPSNYPPFFWELYNRRSAVRVVLQRFGENDNETMILREATYKAIGYSYKKNLRNVQTKTRSWLRDICEDILAGRTQYISSSPEPWAVSPSPLPGNRQFIKFSFSILMNKVIKLAHDLFLAEQWNIGMIGRPIEELIENDGPLRIRWLLSPSKIEFFADPFPIRVKDLCIFFEKYSQLAKKGYVSLISLHHDGKVNTIVEKVFNPPHHQSYPHAFSHDGKIYIIPEEWVTNRIALYQSTDFPTRWERTAVLVKDIAAVDSTVFQHNGLWWLFYISKEDESSTTLFIHYSQNLEGPWQPHKKNPVKSYIGNTRPAGRIFSYRGFLVRPTQDCSESYGGKIVLNRIVELTPQEFKEEPIKIISPDRNDRYNKGIHTINGIEDMVIVDGKRYAFSFLSLKRLLRRAFPRMTSSEGESGPFQVINVPRPIERSVYTSALQKAVQTIKQIPGIAAIYQLGGFKHPGISDVDLLAVFNDDARVSFHPHKFLKKMHNYLFTHNISAISRAHFQQAGKFSVWYEPKPLWGEDLPHGREADSPADREAIHKQTALEFLLENYVDLTIQLKYRVVKMRSTLQHLKAIRPDLELLGISSGAVFEMVDLVTNWMDRWFEIEIPDSYFWGWIKDFYSELEELLNIELRSNPLYIPQEASIRIGRNISIMNGHIVTSQYSGISMHPYLAGSHKKLFNLNMRMNSFRFEFPATSLPKRSILVERMRLYNDIKRHVNEHYSYFDPFITGFSNKIIPSPKDSQ